MKVLTIYRISDYSNPEKVKPFYAEKENCLRNFIREFGSEDLVVICDNVAKETHQMVLKHCKTVAVTNNGNTGTFLASLHLAKELLEGGQYDKEDTVVYLVEDDYIHRAGSKNILLEAFEDLNADYVTLYDHPDKYQNTKDPRHIWRHGRVDVEDEEGVRRPGVIYGTGEETTVFVSTSCHWKYTGSTTMTWATTGVNILEDFEEMVELHSGKPLPMGGTTFTMLKQKGKRLMSPIPAMSGHAEERWLPYFVNWTKESWCQYETEDIS